MRRYLTAAAALTAVIALVVGSASAATVVAQLGRTDQEYFHFGDPALGRFRVAVAGELVDGDDNGSTDSLQGATRMTKISKVLRLQVDSVSLERQIGGVWRLEATAGPLNSGGASSVLLKTPRVGFCVGSNETRLYRIRQVGSVRWSDGRLGQQVQFSGQFLARILNDDPACAADLSLTKSASDNEVTGPDQDYTYSLTVHNGGPIAAGNVVVSDTWPEGLDAPTGLPAGCSYAASARVVTCGLGTMAVNATEVITLNARTNQGVTAFESLDNTANVTSDTADPDGANNTDTASVIVTL
jgi:uncharacterized repeat protein (TIGR01451 family)